VCSQLDAFELVRKLLDKSVNGRVGQMGDSAGYMTDGASLLGLIDRCTLG